MAEAAWRRLLRDCGTGETFPDRPLNGGIMTIALLLSARWGSPLSVGELAIRGWVPPAGPVLERAPWPDVLVSKARCDDGVTLELVLEPHRSSAGDAHELTFRLVEPARRHRLTGDGVDVTVEPDPSGRATVTVPLAGRTSLS